MPHRPTRLEVPNAFANHYRTSDDRWFIMALFNEQRQLRSFLGAIGREELTDDPRFATNTGRVANAEACEAPIAAFIAERDCDEVLAIFERESITAAPVYDIDQLAADPHVVAREILVDLPDADLGHVTMHNVVPRLADTPGAIRSPAPKIGQHTAEILATLGYSGARIAALRAAGAVAG